MLLQTETTHQRKFYSQNGEDVLLAALFPGEQNGFFVEVGCIDGRRFSNTLSFEEAGWRGLCVEAHADYIPRLKANRPGSVICHCAVGASDENDVTFYANSRGSLSTLDSSMEQEWRANYQQWFTGFSEQKVSMRSLDSLFGENGVETIDILSLDIEGYEYEALKGMSLSTYRPRVMVIECDDLATEEKMDTMVLGKGYVKLAKISSNVFYVVEDFDKRIAPPPLQPLVAQVVHTLHPLDSGDDQVRPVSIDVDPLYRINSKYFGNTNPAGGRFKFHDVGFHGDLYLIEMVKSALEHAEFFLETGANVGSTLAYVASRFDRLLCLSCEPDDKAYGVATVNADQANVRLYHETSPELLQRLTSEYSNLFGRTGVFWLDAHGYGFDWPLEEELHFITREFSSGYIFIDDFKVPHLEDSFTFDVYDKYECSYDFVKGSLNPSRQYALYYPNYTDRTSQHHPLVGWGLIAFGECTGFEISTPLKDKIACVKI